MLLLVSLVLINTTTHGQAVGPPFGSFDSPSDGVGIAGEVAVTGWALDNSGIVSVKVYRDPVVGEVSGLLVFVGDATFVAGARPDVAAKFPTYPNSTRAGWGYMLLSNFLPNGGNGTFRLHAIATDNSGNSVTLGQRTVTATNSTSRLPFGTIDTPAQGQTVSGTIINFGWALTPQPGMIPTNGSTITVYIDSIPRGNPSYGHFRPDVAGLFPGLANTSGAIGIFQIDTTKLTNGVHSIFWVATDNRGNTQGLGSRFFTVANGGPNTTFGAGQWRVGSEIAAGRYYSIPASGCYWERQSGLSGSLNDIIANNFIGFAAAQTIVDILPTDLAFQTDADCGTWFNTPLKGLQTVIPGGMWLVGGQITPGIYTTNAQAGCYWERLRDFRGTLDSIIANDFVSGAGQQAVVISATDVGFSSDSDCGTWTRVSSLTSLRTNALQRWQSFGELQNNRELNRRKYGFWLGR
jgi:hypothetical protein